MKKRLFLSLPLAVLMLAGCNSGGEKSGVIDKRTDNFNASNNYSLKLDSSVKTRGGYTEGNFGNANHMEYYRTYSKGDNYTTLLKKNDIDINDSAVYNKADFSEIYSVKVTYATDSKLKFSYGNDKTYSNTIELLNTKDFITKEIKINKSNYIKFSAPDSNVIIKEIVITYNSKASPKEEKLTYDGYRLKLNYTEFDNLVDGETREIPTKVNFNGSNYTVLETKKFTYYSREYLINHYANSMADELAITDPLDVASYYMLFHDFPLNYGYQFDLIDMDLYFKEKNLRRVQKFSRTDGYAKAVPYKKNQDLTYLELDFAESDSYSYNAQRGTGRIVVWENGFDGSGYDNEPVCLYTDDHYASFAEFTNCYSWNTSFDAEMNYTGYKHSVVKTYTL